LKRWAKKANCQSFTKEGDDDAPMDVNAAPADDRAGIDDAGGVCRGRFSEPMAVAVPI
jgi:hypothetical protein